MIQTRTSPLHRVESVRRVYLIHSSVPFTCENRLRVICYLIGCYRVTHLIKSPPNHNHNHIIVNLKLENSIYTIVGCAYIILNTSSLRFRCILRRSLRMTGWSWAEAAGRRGAELKMAWYASLLYTLFSLIFYMCDYLEIIQSLQ